MLFKHFLIYSISFFVISLAAPRPNYGMWLWKAPSFKVWNLTFKIDKMAENPAPDTGGVETDVGDYY